MRDRFVAVFDAVEHLVPFGQIAARRVDAKLAADNLGKAAAFPASAALHKAREGS